MKKLLLVLLIIFGLLIVGCGGGATTTTTNTPAEPVVVVEEPVVEEPVVEEPVVEEPVAEEPVVEEPVVEFTEADLDAAFNAFLGRMVAYNTIRPDALNEQLVEGTPPFILDVRQPSELEEKGHIEGAVHIPLREVAQHLDLLPSFDTPIVAYCGVGWRCTMAMTELGALGWTDIKALIGGSFGGWVEAGFPVVEGPAPEAEVLNAAEPNPAFVAHANEVLSNLPDGWGVITAAELFTELVEKPDLILIDLRQATEIEEKGNIEHANQVNVPLEQFITNKADWPADKDAAIVTYCGTGHRCTMAMMILFNYGYTDVRSLKGGLNGWIEAGNPVAGGTAVEPAAAFGEADLDAAFEAFLGRMVAYNTIRIDDFNTLIVEDNIPFILDVRQPSELEEKGHIEGAVHIPLREVAQHLDLLPGFDTPIVAYCGVGWRCTIAMTELGALGWTNIKALVGGSFGGWLEAGYPVVEGFPPEAEALDAAEPNPDFVAFADEVLTNLPDGWGVITPDDLFTELLENPDLILIDVRKVSEVEENGNIEHENQLLIPIEEFIQSKADWPADKDAEIVVYCGTGHRSTITMTMLFNYGYTNVRSMKGGLAGWVTAGLPVVEYVAP